MNGGRRTAGLRSTTFCFVKFWTSIIIPSLGVVRMVSRCAQFGFTSMASRIYSRGIAWTLGHRGLSNNQCDNLGGHMKRSFMFAILLILLFYAAVSGAAQKGGRWQLLD